MTQSLGRRGIAARGNSEDRQSSTLAGQESGALRIAPVWLSAALCLLCGYTLAIAAVPNAHVRSRAAAHMSGERGGSAAARKLFEECDDASIWQAHLDAYPAAVAAVGAAKKKEKELVRNQSRLAWHWAC